MFFHFVTPSVLVASLSCLGRNDLKKKLLIRLRSEQKRLTRTQRRNVRRRLRLENSLEVAMGNPEVKTSQRLH